MFFLCANLIKFILAWLYQKKQLFWLYFFFSGTALMKLRQTRLCKINFSGSKKYFFRMPLVKSANSTLLPRLSLLQLVQMHAIQN